MFKRILLVITAFLGLINITACSANTNSTFASISFRDSKGEILTFVNYPQGEAYFIERDLDSLGGLRVRFGSYDSTIMGLDSEQYVPVALPKVIYDYASKTEAGDVSKGDTVYFSLCFSERIVKRNKETYKYQTGYDIFYDVQRTTGQTLSAGELSMYVINSYTDKRSFSVYNSITREGQMAGFHSQATPTTEKFMDDRGVVEITKLTFEEEYFTSIEYHFSDGRRSYFVGERYAKKDVPFSVYQSWLNGLPLV